MRGAVLSGVILSGFQVGENFGGDVQGGGDLALDFRSDGVGGAEGSDAREQKVDIDEEAVAGTAETQTVVGEAVAGGEIVEAGADGAPGRRVGAVEESLG